MSIDLSDFTTGQVAFIKQLAANTGLDSGVIAAWVIQEESGSAAQARQAVGNHDWLNIGYTDSATLGSGNSVWSNPTAAANATANWLKGTWSDPGFGPAASSIRAILKTAGQSPSAQIVTIQHSGWASSAYPHFQTIYGELSTQLKQTIGAGVAKGGVAGSGGSGTVVDGSSTTTYAFSISGVDNPDEDYWTGINRLAQEVNWYLFTSGEYLYYLDGQEMLAQTPAAKLDRVKDGDRFYENQGTLTYDNTSYQYTSTHRRKFRVQRRTKVAIATSPTEGDLEVICGIDEILGGDVVELSNFGLGDGRWIVGEARRSVFDVYTELTLVPALAPITEVGAAGTTGSGTGETGTTTVGGAYPTTLTGTYRDKVVQAAKSACARQAKDPSSYIYREVRPYPSSLFGKAPVITDCSGFSILCYKAAGAPDPNGTGYNGQGYTGTLSPRGTTVSTPQPGDLCFYFDPISHVNVYVGNGQCANMGGKGEPVLESITAPGKPVLIKSYL